MPELKAYDVVILDTEGEELPFEITWFYYSMKEAWNHADEENQRLTRHRVAVLRERKLK